MNDCWASDESDYELSFFYKEGRNLHSFSMPSFNFIKNFFLLAALCLCGFASHVTSLALQARDSSPYDAGCGNPVSLLPHECNLAFMNLPWQTQRTQLQYAGTKLIGDYGSCEISVSCPNGINVDSQLVLTNNGNGGYGNLLQQCINRGLAGQIYLNGGCLLTADRIQV